MIRKRTSLCVLFLLGISLIACNVTKTNVQGLPVPDNSGEYGGSGHSKKADSLAVARIFIDACKAKALGDYEGAMQLFSDVLRLDPLNDATLYEMGRIYFEYGKLDDAREMLRLATEQDKYNPYYLSVYGNVLLYLANYREAVEVYRELVALKPDDMDSYFELSFAQERAGKVDESLQTLLDLEQRFGSDESIMMEEYRIYLRNGMIPEAISTLQRLIAKNGLEPLYYGMLAELYDQNNQPILAEETFKILLELDPDNADLQFKRATFLERAGDMQAYYETLNNVFSNPEASIDQKVFFLVPYVDSIDIKGFYKKDSILQLARLMTEAHPQEAKAFAMQGDLLYYANQKLEARKSYMKSTQLRGDVYDVWMKLFYIDAEEMQWDSLFAVTNRSLELFPNQALGYYFNGVALMNIDREEDAIRQFKKSIPMAGSNSQLKAEIWLRLGDTYHSLKQHAESDHAYDQSLLIDPNNPYTLNNYAYYLSLRGEQLEKAAVMAEKANRLVEANASLLDTWAWVLYKQKEYKEAETIILQALSAGGTTSAAVNEHYGDILFRLGKETEALEFWKKAKQLGDTNPELEKKILDGRLYE